MPIAVKLDLVEPARTTRGDIGEGSERGFDVNTGRMPFARHQARAAGNRLALQDPVELKPQIVMEPRRVVLLHTEAVAGRLVKLRPLGSAVFAKSLFWP